MRPSRRVTTACATPSHVLHTPQERPRIIEFHRGSKSTHFFSRSLPALLCKPPVDRRAPCRDIDGGTTSHKHIHKPVHILYHYIIISLYHYIIVSVDRNLLAIRSSGSEVLAAKVEGSDGAVSSPHHACFTAEPPRCPMAHDTCYSSPPRRVLGRRAARLHFTFHITPFTHPFPTLLHTTSNVPTSSPSSPAARRGHVICRLPSPSLPRTPIFPAACSHPRTTKDDQRMIKDGCSRWHLCVWVIAAE